jgi:hypothetical protein
MPCFLIKITKTFRKLILIIFLYFYFFIFTENKKSLFILKNCNYKIYKIIKREIQDLLNINIKYLDSLYIIGSYNFGNFIVSLNNAIIFCEFFHCKRIILQSNNNTFINNKIFYKKYNYRA